MDTYHNLIEHFESCLEKHGDSHLGVDWPNERDAKRRYQVMLDVIRETSDEPVPTLLDFGCGASHLNEYVSSHPSYRVAYTGLDISPKFIALSQAKFPTTTYYCGDILTDRLEMPIFDYVVMNGVFTEKRSIPFDSMFSYFQKLIATIFPFVRVGLAFNVMSKHVDWEREDLFHLSYDSVAAFLKRDVSRHFVFRADYGLYEYTAYVYRQPS